MKRHFYGDPINTLVAEYNYYQESSNEKKIAQTLLCHIRDIPSWTLEDAAYFCHVSLSTCRRFIHNLGFETYSEFRIKITDQLLKFDFISPPAIDIHHIAKNTYLQNCISDIKSDLDILKDHITLESMMDAVYILHDQKHIFIHDLLKNGMRIALQKNLAISGKFVTMSYDSDTQRHDAHYSDKESAFILINDGHSHSRELTNTIRLVHKNGGKIIVISQQKTFPESNLCDTILYINHGTSTLSSMIILDLTYQYLAELYKCMFITGNIDTDMFLD